MQSTHLVESLKADTISVIDQFGCQCSAQDVIDFIGRAIQLSVTEIGRKTFLFFDAQPPAQTVGLNASFVVMLTLTSELPVLTLSAQPTLRLAS